MSQTWNGPASSHKESGPEKFATQLASEDQSNGTGHLPALFDAVVEHHAYGRETTFVPSKYIVGPGPHPATIGPQDAGAPEWWWTKAESVVMDLVRGGRTCSSDDLHDAFPDEPSASGAAFGGLFARLAREGRIVEVGMVKSRRPEARRRRIILWGAA